MYLTVHKYTIRRWHSQNLDRETKIFIIQLDNYLIVLLYKEVNIMEDNQKTLENETTLSSEEMKLLVVMGRALSDPTRIRILGLLAERSMYGQELAKALDVTPPTISHHLSPLVMAGLVRVRRENSYHYYELSSEGLEHLAESAQHIASLLFPA